jgi:signal transduction histidine kinase
MRTVLVTFRGRLEIPPLAVIAGDRSTSSLRKVLLLLVGTLLIGAATGAQSSKSVLVLHGGWSGLPFNVITNEQIEKEFNAGKAIHPQIFNEYIDEKRLDPDRIQFSESLRRKYVGHKIDVILAVSPAALDFLLENIVKLWPGVPVVFSMVDYRMVPEHLPPNFTGVTAAVDFGGTLELALRLQPDTEHVFYVVGSSQYEQFLRRAASSEFERYARKLDFEYLQGLPLARLLNRVAQLPPHSVVFYQEVNKDSNGDTYVPAQVCGQVALASNSPVYAPHSVMMGKGVVAGSLVDYAGVARDAAHLGNRILTGERVEQLPVEPGPPNVNHADWRQLQRWGFSESRLPAGTLVDYREPGLWQKYRSYLILGILAFALQSVLIVALALGAQRRKWLGMQLRDLSRRLINAQEGERRRIARELHDDLNQRMVLLLSHIERLAPSDNGKPGQVADISREAREISMGISHLSHQLHSSALDILGLEPALRGLTRDLSLAYGIDIRFVSEDQLVPMSNEINLCLFRVAQESLSNVVKHSSATTVEVRLSCADKQKAIRLTVVDDGKGFDPSKVQSDSLGVISMRERLRLVDGELLINSSPNRGTEVVAHVRLSEARSLVANA